MCSFSLGASQTSCAKRASRPKDTSRSATRNTSFKKSSFVYQKRIFCWRRHPDLNRGMRVLQTLALPLGYSAAKLLVSSVLYHNYFFIATKYGHFPFFLIFCSETARHNIICAGGALCHAADFFCGRFRNLIYFQILAKYLIVLTICEVYEFSLSYHATTCTCVSSVSGIYFTMVCVASKSEP